MILLSLNLNWICFVMLLKYWKLNAQPNWKLNSQVQFLRSKPHGQACYKQYRIPAIEQHQVLWQSRIVFQYRLLSLILFTAAAKYKLIIIYRVMIYLSRDTKMSQELHIGLKHFVFKMCSYRRGISIDTNLEPPPSYLLGDEGWGIKT